MGGREVDGVVHRLVEDGRPQRLRQLDQVVDGARTPDAVAGDDRGGAGPEQRFGQFGRHLRRRQGPRTSVRVRKGLIQLLLEDVDRDRDHHRPRRRRLGEKEGAPNKCRQVLDLVDLDRVLERALGKSEQVAAEHRVVDQVAAVLLADGDHHRSAGTPGIEHVRQAVRQPGGDVQVEKRGSPGRARVTVSHRDRRSLVQPEVVVELRHPGELVHEGQLGGARVAEDAIDALALGQFDQSAARPSR